jgi:hypothetical protein
MEDNYLFMLVDNAEQVFPLAVDLEVGLVRTTKGRAIP